jgi:hypothetical protein
MSHRQRILWPLGAGLAGVVGLGAVYMGIVSWAESPAHAVELFWQDRLIVIPIMLGFGVQAALYTILKKRLFVPVAATGPSGPLMGTGGATSTLAMAACCAHHVADVVPILGLTTAATFLAEYRTTFMWVGLGTTLAGVALMLVVLFRERRRSLSAMRLAMEGIG